MTFPITMPEPVPDGLVPAIETAGVLIVCSGGEWLVSDVPAALAVIASFDPANPPPGPVPEEVSIFQFLMALASGGWITQAEALSAAKTGEMPATLLALATNATAEEQFALALRWAAMYRVRRDDPLWDAVVVAGIATSEAVDGLFRTAATIL